MTSVAVPMCYACARLDSGGDEMRCTAYPDGIPVVILTSEVDHRSPYEGDNGLQFQQDPTAPPFDPIAFEGAS